MFDDRINIENGKEIYTPNVFSKKSYIIEDSKQKEVIYRSEALRMLFIALIFISLTLSIFGDVIPNAFNISSSYVILPVSITLLIACLVMIFKYLPDHKKLLGEMKPYQRKAPIYKNKGFAFAVFLIICLIPLGVLVILNFVKMFS